MIRFLITFFASIIAWMLILPVLVLLLPIILFTGLVRLAKRILETGVSEWQEVVLFDSEIGWKLRPNLDTRYVDMTGNLFRIQTDAEGWPGSRSIEECEIVVFGDSFAFGYGVGGKDSYFNRTEKCRVKPIGAPGYDMVQGAFLMRRYAHRLNKKFVVWFLCIENDLADNFRAYAPSLHRKPFVRRNGRTTEWEIATEHVNSDRWQCGDTNADWYIPYFAQISTRCAYSERVISAAEYLVRMAAETCQEAGAELVVFPIPFREELSERGRARLKEHLAAPDTFRAHYVESRLCEICARLNVAFIRGSEFLTAADYKKRDYHWNANGNRKVAEAVEKLFLNHQSARSKSERMVNQQ